ncbi:MAG: type II toxin-antitoxin system MqsA family antitoxin [Actinomycetota bacterium]|nr:type II toxin-antitoxin system MqsA family antitoxin [Actinomycetota bacterium]MDZ4178656.1 type II toxin-antitoxin system MqsA family antitoxin [Coriobacteriia bacterium]
MIQERAVCSVCGQRAIEITRDPITVEFREGSWSIQPHFDYERCRACGEELYPAEGLSELTRQAVAMARRDIGLLTPDEIREMRPSLGLTQHDLDRALGVSRGLIGKWERGEVFQSATADRPMRVIREAPELLHGEALAFVAREGRGPYRTRGE